MIDHFFMVCDRFAFIIIWFALSGFYPTHSWAAKPNLFSHKVINDQNLLPKDLKLTTTTSNISQINSNKDQLEHIAVKTTNKITKVQPISPNNSADLEPPSEVNYFWPLVAMSGTTIIALGLIYVLFRKPQQQRELATEISPVPIDKQSQSSKIEINQEVQGFALVPSQQANQSETGQLTTQLDSSVVKIDPVQELVSALKYHENSQTKSLPTELKRRAIWKLSELGEYQSIEPLLKVMPQVGATNKNLILEIVKQINQHSFQSINNKLFAALQNENPEVRVAALQDLKNLYQFISPAITKIAQMQSDPDYQVRQMAVEILRQFNTSPLPTFVNYSQDEIDNLIMGKESEANLHLVAYLLAELDAVDK